MLTQKAKTEHLAARIYACLFSLVLLLAFGPARDTFAFQPGEKGKAEGLAEGEIKGKLEIAKNLIAKGFDDKTILELTGFTAEEIKKYFP